MWSDVERQLAELLATESFPTLLGNPGYMHMLANAGMSGIIPRDPTELRPSARLQFTEAARMCAQLVTLHVEGMNSLRERRAKAVTLEGPTILYRLWSQRHSTRIGPWWFTDGVLKQALSESGGNQTVALAWLRDRLAVSLDWSDCDRVVQLTLHNNNRLPAIEAWGLPVRQYSPDALNRGVRPADYWARYAAMFQGQKTQYFLPFVPETRVRDYW